MSESEAIWTEADQARADLIAEIACEISESEDVVAMALDAYDARRSPVERAAPDLYKALKAQAEFWKTRAHGFARDPAWVKLVEASFTALSKASQQQGTTHTQGQQNEGAESK